MTTTTSKAPIRFFAPSSGVEKCPGCGKVPQGAGFRITVPGKWYSWHADCFEKKDVDPTREASSRAACSLCSGDHADGTCLL